MGIRVLLELPRSSLQMVLRANGGARSAAFSLACLLPSLVCVALRPPPPCAHAGGGCSLGPESGAASFRHWRLDVARATANGLGFTAIRLRGDAENGRDCAEENKAVG